MTLKHVVLPAPFGPISPRISPFLMSKLTWSRAVRPPKRIVTSSTSSSACVSDMAALRRLALELLDLRLDPLDASGPARRQQALRPPDRERHQRDPEQQVAVVAHPTEALGQVRDHHRTRD